MGRPCSAWVSQAAWSVQAYKTRGRCGTHLEVAGALFAFGRAGLEVVVVGADLLLVGLLGELWPETEVAGSATTVGTCRQSKRFGLGQKVDRTLDRLAA
jgi:hypothetical protein